MNLKLSFERLNHLLKDFGFVAENVSVRYGQDKVLYAILVHSLKKDEEIYFVNGPLVGNVYTSSSNSFEAVLVNILRQLTAPNTIYIGKHRDYSAMLEWDDVKECFTRRDLTEKEKKDSLDFIER